MTILQCNIERALWISRQVGFIEGKAADEEERQRRAAGPSSRRDPGAIAQTSLAEFAPAAWSIVPRSDEWVWTTLKDEGLRFRLDLTPYECSICLSNCEGRLQAAKLRRASAGPEVDAVELDKIEQEVRKLEADCDALRQHRVAIGKQRTYNINMAVLIITANIRVVRVTMDFGASYFIDGSRFIDLVYFLKYLGDDGDLVTECIFNLVSALDEISEDACCVRAVWEHLLGAARVFDRWDSMLVVRDSGPHFQNNNICYYESTIFSKYSKRIRVSAFAKRHGFNECDGSHARLVQAVRNKAMERSPPSYARGAASEAGVMNEHEKFQNCTA